MNWNIISRISLLSVDKQFIVWEFYFCCNFSRHHQHGRWQARIGRVAGNKDLYLGTFSEFLWSLSFLGWNSLMILLSIVFTLFNNVWTNNKRWKHVFFMTLKGPLSLWTIFLVMFTKGWTLGLHNASSQQWPKLLLKFCQSGFKKKRAFLRLLLHQMHGKRYSTTQLVN